MSYMIAVVSDDKNFVEGSFGNATSIIIIDVNNNGSTIKKEDRSIPALSSMEEKVNLIADCRCILCKCIEPGAIKQLDKRGITRFQVDCKMDEALVRIAEYYLKIDNPNPLRKAK